MAKSTKAEAQKRTRIVLEMLLQSTPTCDIIQYGIDKWAITDNGVLKYITAAYSIMKKLAAVDREEAYARNLAERQYLKNKAIKAADFRLAHEVVRDEAKLRGLYPTEKHENFNFDLSQMTIEQLEMLANGADIYTVLASKSAS